MAIVKIYTNPGCDLSGIGALGLPLIHGFAVDAVFAVLTLFAFAALFALLALLAAIAHYRLLSPV